MDMNNNFLKGVLFMNFSGSNQKNVMMIGNRIFVDGQELPPCPGKGYNSTIVDGKIYVNGWEWIEGKDGKEGKWKRTLKALWYKWF